MRPRFQADADLDGRVIRTIRRLAPEMDFQTATEAGLEGVPDEQVLSIAAADGRIVVSQDRGTMPGHFHRFLERNRSPGLMVLREAIQIVDAAEELVLIWSASLPEDWENQIVWLPL